MSLAWGFGLVPDMLRIWVCMDRAGIGQENYQLDGKPTPKPLARARV